MPSPMQERPGRPDPVQVEAQGVLRTAYSSPDPKALVDLVRASYGVPVERARFLRRGLNDTYRLNGAGHQQWVFRLYRRWRSAEDVNFAIMFSLPKLEIILGRDVFKGVFLVDIEFRAGDVLGVE